MDTAQEAIYRAMVNDGWLTDSADDGEGGYAGFVTNTGAEWAEVADAFSDVIDTYGAPLITEFIGSWVVSINSDGVIRIVRTPNDRAARDLFERMTEHTN